MTWRIPLSFLLCALPLAADEMWVELGPAPTGFEAIARYASREAKTCPAIQINGRKRAMTPRINTGGFEALVCQAAIPAGARTAKINGQALPLPGWANQTRNPKIVVIGDTGCRVKQGFGDALVTTGPWNIQNCESPQAWPFQEVAEHAAAEKPDLVIHVGDFVYREMRCTGVTGCPGGPSGDKLETWEADFFTPAKKLLEAAPWVFVRGNHEDCGRSGNGWFSLLDPRAVPACVRYTEPYLLTTNLGVTLAVLDTNPATDAPCPAGDSSCAAQFAEQIATYTKAFETISSWKLKHSWMVTHRPVWSVRAGLTGDATVLNAVEEAAWKQHRPMGIDLILAGHTHVFEMIGFDPGSDRPMQLVVGNSGTKLAGPLKFNAAAPAVQAAAIQEFRQIQDFGYTMLTPAAGTSGAGAWNVLAHARDGKVDISCEIEGGKARCRKEN